MGHLGALQDERVKLDCSSSHTTPSSCRSKCSAESIMGGLFLKTPISHPSRRQSLRLKEISAIYESEDASLPPSEGGSSFVANKVKLEILSPHHSPIKSTDLSYGNNEIGGDSDDLSIESMTLKDLQATVRAKKRKVSKFISSPEADLKSKDTDLKMSLEEEEIDLEEPLISLKLKLSKRRKHARHARSAAQGSLPVLRDPTTDTLSTDTAAGLHELKSPSETPEENSGAMINNISMEIDDSPIPSATDMQRDADIAELVSKLESKKVGNCSMEGKDSKNSVTSTPDPIEPYNFLRYSFSEPFQEVSEGESIGRDSICITGKVLMEMDTHNSSSAVPELDTSLQGNPDLVYNIKRVNSENNSNACENTVYIDESSNTDFIAKYDYPQNPSDGVLERADGGEGQNAELTCSIGSSLHGYVDEVPIEYMEPGKENSSVSLEQSMHIHTTDPLYSSAMDPSHEDMEISNVAELNLGGEDSRNLVDQEPGKQMLEVNHTNDGAIDQIVLPMEASNADVGLNSNLHPDEGSPKTEKLLASSVKPMLNGYKDEATCCFPKTFTSMNGEGFAELDCTYQISPCSLDAVNGLLHSDNNFPKAAEEVSSLATDISCLGDTELDDPVSELRCDEGLKVLEPPRKILSTRKEKLRQALNDSGFYDATKHSEPERMIKKTEGHRIGHLPPVSKGILKSPEASNWSQIQTQEAIRFSLRQMQDIKSIATKLLKGLNSMKDIVEETLDSGACSSVPLKFTEEEMRSAADQASELEVTTNKWLSIMSKDCNRFCKILRTTENKATSPNGVRKERKKMIFADQAGRDLCHVKIFDQ